MKRPRPKTICYRFCKVSLHVSCGSPALKASGHSQGGYRPPFLIIRPQSPSSENLGFLSRGGNVVCPFRVRDCPEIDC